MKTRVKVFLTNPGFLEDTVNEWIETMETEHGPRFQIVSIFQANGNFFTTTILYTIK